jgi:hypothetical protein
MITPSAPTAHHDGVLDALPSDIRAARLADIGAVLGIASLATLILMFAIEVPRGGPYRFGTTNDLLSAGFSALFIPIAWRLARALPPGQGFRALTWATLGAAAAGTVLPILLVAGVLPFAIQTPLVVACFEIQALWLVAAGRQWQRLPGLRRFGRLSQAVGASFIAGTVIVAGGFALPDGPLRLAAWAVGGLAGGVAWIGWPYWYHAAATVLRRSSEG